MSAKIDFENALYELEQTTATLGFVQTAFAEGESLIDNDESAAAIYMLYSRQRSIVNKLKEEYNKINNIILISGTFSNGRPFYMPKT